MRSFTPVNFSFSQDEAPSIAYKNSPDLRVLAATKKAMEQSLKYVKKTYLPDLTVTVGYGYTNGKTNSDLRESNNGLQIEAGLKSNVNIKELYHSIKGADAQVELANNEIDLFKQNLYFKIERSFNNLEISEKRVSISQEAAQKAFNVLKLIVENYKQGEIDYTALQDGRKDFLESEEAYINSLYEYNMSLIQLEMAMHIHVADIHHKSEHALRYHANELLEHINKALACDEKELKKNRHKDLEEDL